MYAALDPSRIASLECSETQIRLELARTLLDALAAIEQEQERARGKKVS